MPRIHLLASAVALAICSVTAAHAQEFSKVISFGDSLTDAGNVAALNGLPAGFSFTTNPDPVSVQLIAAAYGFNQTNISPLIPGSAGTNYAYGGACVQPNSVSFSCQLSPGAFSITTQVTGYLTANGGHADGGALYTMWGGANDIFSYAGLAGAHVITQAQAAGGVAVSAGTEAGLITALQTAGAKNIIVFNLPDIGSTPEFRGTANQASITGLTLIFNGQLNAAMAGKTGIIPVDTFGLVNEVLANPGLYGFTNVTAPACTGAGTPSSVACGPAGSPLPYTYAAGTNQTYLFADGVHPTGAGHALLAQAVLAEIAAPSYISMLGEAPLQVFETQTRALGDQMQADLARTREAGSLRTFASVDYSRQRFDATSSSPRTSSNNTTLTVGGDYYANDAISVGMASSFAYQSADFAGGGGYKNVEPLLSAFGVWHSPNAYVSAVASVGQLNFNSIERNIVLGPTTRVEQGKTTGTHTGFQLEGGYYFQLGDTMKTGPYASVANQRVSVDSFYEKNGDSTSMVFGRQKRNSNIYKLGWQLTSYGSSWRPYAKVAYEHEADGDIRSVNAGSATLNGTFSMPGFQPDSSWWDAELGLSADLGDNFTGYAAYNGQFGNSTVRVDSINLGMKFSF